MPTALRIDTVLSGQDTPRLDPSARDLETSLIIRLKRDNRALDTLRAALEVDEARVAGTERDRLFS